MKNTLHDLNNHLFAALERLNDEDLTPEQVEQEIKRSHASAKVGQSIIANANLQLKAEQMFTNGELRNIPKQLVKQ
ncbi:MAG: hypothetical protein DWP95_05660 [Proteobacteria bacterium]|nr:MAG: hypothetical protein DWP95_05660 [Pseudomonadota bacterium]